MSGQDMLWGKLRTEVNYLSGLLGFQNQAISRSDYAIAVFFFEQALCVFFEGDFAF